MELTFETSEEASIWSSGGDDDEDDGLGNGNDEGGGDDDGNHDGKKQVEMMVSQHQILTLHWPGLAAMCLFSSGWSDMLLSQWR